MGYMFFLALVLLLPRGAAVHEAPVTEFWGQDVVILDPAISVTLPWYILPGNATVYWVRCYSGATVNTTKHIYTYNFNTREIWQGANTSIIHSVHYRAHRPIVFKLILEGPVEEGSDLYMCELEGRGMGEPLNASLHLRVFLQPTEQAVSKDAYSTEPTHAMTDGTRDNAKLSFDYDVNLTTPVTTHKCIAGHHQQDPLVIFVAAMVSIMFVIACAYTVKMIVAGSFPFLRFFQSNDGGTNGIVKYKASGQDGVTDKVEYLEEQDKLIDI